MNDSLLKQTPRKDKGETQNNTNLINKRTRFELFAKNEKNIDLIENKDASGRKSKKSSKIKEWMKEALTYDQLKQKSLQEILDVTEYKYHQQQAAYK